MNGRRCVLMTLFEFLHRIYVPSRLSLTADSVYEIEIVIARFDIWCGDPVDIRELTDEMVCGFLHWRLISGCAPSTVNSNRSKLLALWNCAWRKRMHAEQPRDVPRLAEPQKMPEAWTKSQVEQLVACAQSLEGCVDGLPARYWWASLILGIWDTSARIGAIRQAYTADCDLDKHSLLLRFDSQKHKADQLFYLGDNTIVMLRPIYRPTRKWLWPWPHCKDHLWRTFRRIVEAAGLSAPRSGKNLFHKLRRSHLSYIARVDLDLARRQAGHTSSRTTERHYIDPRIAQQQSARDVLPRLDIPIVDQQLRLF